MTDIAELALAWRRGHVAALLPYVVGVRPAADRTYALLDTATWCAIMDELDRQTEAAYDMKAAALGHRSWAKMLRYLSRLIEDNQAEEAARLYWAVVRDTTTWG